ncbi:flagellar biosynthesis anti-sigma factor FlgM [Chitinivibrio alkaliphilus]|uniref:Anti-sigma-28 factor, FlgM n=1 Tax=Chitinivibrio alkaliphilus ACht1 TaxID=1313304 RepID=U7DA99_9BACT|nr:flagellar biosynthesis anti-sigma factor FlgM [Chitinivibrio alkaliphilus]ERP32057.1 anti-sigma-28 factor, FlgM [Chitinivibrio alkaliphilus ACht1]
MRLESINNMVSAEFRKIHSTSDKKKTAGPQSPSRTGRTDTASLSASAAKTHGTEAQAQLLSARLDAEPDIRDERISDVQEKIESGYYNSSNFADTLADKLIGDFGL